MLQEFECSVFLTFLLQISSKIFLSQRMNLTLTVYSIKVTHFPHLRSCVLYSQLRILWPLWSWQRVHCTPFPLKVYTVYSIKVPHFPRLRSCVLYSQLQILWPLWSWQRVHCTPFPLKVYTVYSIKVTHFPRLRSCVLYSQLQILRPLWPWQRVHYVSSLLARIPRPCVFFRVFLNP